MTPRAIAALADEIGRHRTRPFRAGRPPPPRFRVGVHRCIGNALAHREGELALRWIVERFETVEQIGPVAVNEPFIHHGLTTLPIRWTVRR